MRQHAKKFAATIDTIYIAGPRNKAYQNISVSSDKIPSDSLAQLLQEKHPLESWQRLFAAITQSEIALDDSEFDNLKIRTLGSSSIGVTPRKRAERYGDSKNTWDTEDSTKVSPNSAMLMADVQEVDTEVLAAQMDKILTLTKNNASGLDKLRREVGQDIDRLEVAVQETSCKVWAQT